MALHRVPRTVFCIVSMVLLLAVALGCELMPGYEGDLYAKPIEAAHNAKAYRAHQALRATFSVDFGGERMVEGVMTFDTPLGLARIETTDGQVYVFDGTTAWVSPAEADVPMARFHVLTWPYFVALPFKLRDEGTMLAALGDLRMDGQLYAGGRLTFEEGVGDTPDDWYIIYRDLENNHLHAVAYIVTFGKSTAEANKEPHAAVYESYTRVDGVMLPTKLVFYDWNRATGITGDPLGEFVISDYAFVSLDPMQFVKPADAREAPLPE